MAAINPTLFDDTFSALTATTKGYGSSRSYVTSVEAGISQALKLLGANSPTESIEKVAARRTFDVLPTYRAAASTVPETSSLTISQRDAKDELIGTLAAISKQLRENEADIDARSRELVHKNKRALYIRG